jgi:mycofactocin system creatininase family protein
MTTLEVAAGRWHLLVPLGSTEQHGPHLPLDTDTRIAVAVAESAAAHMANAVVAPALPIGAAGEHAGFAGTLSIGSEAATAMLVEIVRTAGAEFESITVVNGHGGNHAAVRAAIERCEYEGRPLRSWSPAHRQGDAHAGRTETSVMLAIAPGVVRLDRAEAGATGPIGDMIDDLRARGVAAVAPNGVLGDPAGASAQEGGVIIDTWVAEVVAMLQT